MQPIYGKYRGFITIHELLNDSVYINPIDKNNIITYFCFSAFVSGMDSVLDRSGVFACSKSKKITSDQTKILEHVIPGSSIYIDVGFKLPNNEAEEENYIFCLDGVNADFIRLNDTVSVIDKILKHPRIHVYPDFSTLDTSMQYYIKSFELHTMIDDRLYKFKSNSNEFTKPMIDFLKSIDGKNEIHLADIIAIDKNNNEIKLLQRSYVLNLDTDDYSIERYVSKHL